jgi:hypothetical protein
MRTLIAICIVALAACKPGADRDREHETTTTAADTLVTRRQVEDTAIVRSETTVRIDTNIEKDTVRKSGSRRPTDTARTGTTRAKTDTTVRNP